jgi:hypothetical protein
MAVGPPPGCLLLPVPAGVAGGPPGWTGCRMAPAVPGPGCGPGCHRHLCAGLGDHGGSSGRRHRGAAPGCVADTGRAERRLPHLCVRLGVGYLVRGTVPRWRAGRITSTGNGGRDPPGLDGHDPDLRRCHVGGGGGWLHPHHTVEGLASTSAPGALVHGSPVGHRGGFNWPTTSISPAARSSFRSPLPTPSTRSGLASDV